MTNPASPSPGPAGSADDRVDEPAAEVALDVAADPDRVWRALTTEDGLAPWMGEGARLDPRPGGAVALPDPVGGATRRGRVDRVDEGHRLDFTWWPALRPADRTEVSITVEELDGGSASRIRVVERRPEPAMARAEVDDRAVTAGAIAAGRAVVAAGQRTARDLGRGGARLSIGLWSWRLAALSVGVCLSRV